MLSIVPRSTSLLSLLNDVFVVLSALEILLSGNSSHFLLGNQLLFYYYFSVV